uniref:ADP-ribosylation factor-like protein 15 n=1 Tax=Oryctolagus cuniculus TaxID=9986 RepID=A0A5F9CDP9_RABIT
MSDLRITEAFLYMDYLCFRALCCKGPPPARPEYDLVCIGLTGSGKTSLLSKLCSESAESVVSTTGFSIKAVPFQNAILNVKELGGADNIRKYWSRYYQGSQGVIFVLDSASSEDDLETARNELHSALQHPQLCTLPFLILANHQDKPAARSIQEHKGDWKATPGMMGPHPVSMIYLGIPTEVVKKPGMLKSLASSMKVKMSFVLTGTAAFPPG